ncbi:MAG: AhpC/TSA family protein [Myxococcota bacterium]|nr:AhpC/TSA family protein [Myxococcota bacterium]
MRLIVLLGCLLTFACRAEEPPLNPYKGKGRAGPSQVEQEVANAPPATVTKRDGNQIDLATMWAKQKVLVVFYRGGWCPYCKKQLTELQTNQRKIADAGAIIVGISSDSSEDANKTRDSLQLNFELYSDPQLAVISQWGVEDVGSNIARPAAFVVEPGGRITYRRIGKSPADSPSIEELVSALEKN